MPKRIALIWPYARKNFQTPLWALSLGAYLRKKIPDIEIDILDEQIEPVDTIFKKISRIKPDIVGISLSYTYYEDALKFARKAKLGGAKVVFGGTYASVFKKEILENRGPYSKDYCVDVVIQRDGERAFYEYVSGKELSEINNLVYQTETGIQENPLKLLNLELLPAPNRNLINPEDYIKRHRITKEGPLRILNAYFQKGCGWREKTGGCIFCCSLESRLRLRNARDFSEELGKLVSDYSLEWIKIDGEDFLANEDWLKAFAKFWIPRLHKFVNIPSLMVSARADGINERTIALLKKINTRNIFIGFESGDERCLAAVRKGVSLRIMKKAADLLNRHEIRITGSFILGLPGETPETLKKTTNFIKDLSALSYFRSAQFQTFTPLPGSSAWKMFLEKVGVKYQGKDLINWNEVRKEWVMNFTHLKRKDIEATEEEFERLAARKKDASFLFVDRIKF